jgi:transcriptional regulator GlxA family with amidase domain
MNTATLSVAIYVYPEVEVLDFAGPYEVFTTASRVHRKKALRGPEPFKVFTVAREEGTVRARAGLVVTPDFTMEKYQHPPVDVLVVPGGVVTAELELPMVTDWIRGVAAKTQITASVCTGAFLLAQAGLLDGRKVATHWEDVEELRAVFPKVTVLDEGRWVDEGSVVTSAGISAGMDMSLHLVERLAGRELAVLTARQMDYAWRDGV